MTPKEWEFEYTPARPPTFASEPDVRWIISTTEPLDDRCSRELGQRLGGRIAPALELDPLYWYELILSDAQTEDVVTQVLEQVAPGPRFAVSASRPSARLAPALTITPHLPDAAPSDGRWSPRSSSTVHEVPTDGRWFVHDPTGVHVERALCGTGAGTRLAVIDDEGRDVDALPLDTEIVLGDRSPPRGASHGAAMVAWAVGSKGRTSRPLPPFVGVAPDASPRLYLIPKPDAGILWLPLAIVTSVRDGADVVLCATYVDDLASPLLDDALEFAAQAGREGKGAAVIMPTGREVSSPPGSASASLTLRLADPASDARVLCVAPSGRKGGWFLWKDKEGRLRPFSNRGPAVRVSAPGDDIDYPFTASTRLGHAESSGASAIAAGVALLTLSNNPSLEQQELYDLLTETAIPSDALPEGPIADPADLLPMGRDADGHEAKCGYGRVSAQRACLAARDPVCRVLLRMGEPGAARWYALLRGSAPMSDIYSAELAQWGARAAGADPELSYRLSMILRHLRLVAPNGARHASHGTGSLTKLVALVLRRLVQVLERSRAPGAVQTEARSLAALAEQATRSTAGRQAVEAACLSIARAAWPSGPADATDSPEDPALGAEETSHFARVRESIGR